jgi:hypothetical protein
LPRAHPSRRWVPLVASLPSFLVRPLHSHARHLLLSTPASAAMAKLFALPCPAPYPCYPCSLPLPPYPVPFLAPCLAPCCLASPVVPQVAALQLIEGPLLVVLGRSRRQLAAFANAGSAADVYAAQAGTLHIFQARGPCCGCCVSATSTLSLHDWVTRGLQARCGAAVGGSGHVAPRLCSCCRMFCGGRSLWAPGGILAWWCSTCPAA